MRTIDATGGVQVLDTRSTASLLSQVLWITMGGFVATAVGAYIAPSTQTGLGVGALFLLSLGMMFGINILSRRSPGLALGLFYAFAFMWGILLGPMLQAYMHMQGGTAVVFDAAVTTSLGLGIMAAVAQVATFNYQRVGRVAFFALIGLCLVGLLGFFVHVVSPGLYAWATLAIFSVLLLVDFMRIKNAGASMPPVVMALSIYMDALNIFIALLQIFGNGNGRRSGNSGGWR